MSRYIRPLLASLLAAVATLSAVAQQPPPPPRPPAAPAVTTPPVTLPSPKPAEPGAVAATVNGQPIMEVAVQRGLRRVPPARHAEARPEILGLLVDNLLIDQHLLQLGYTVEQKEIDARMQQVRDEIKRVGQNKPDRTYEKILQELLLTDAELQAINASDLRWDKYANKQATDKAVREFFDSNKEMFDGTMVRALHILLTPPGNDAKAAEQARADLLKYRQEIEQIVAKGLVELKTTDALVREQTRTKLLEEAFGDKAREKSACPSKQQGGDVEWFPRGGSMVEPFAAAAFGLKTHEMSGVVQTQFGYHLILATDRRPGKETKFEDVQADVKEIYCDRLREQLANQLRPAAKIVVNPPPKP